MKVIIAGSRSCQNVEDVYQAILYSLYDISEVVSGTCRGADRLGEAAAIELNIPIKRFPADWDKFGKSAGYIRNGEMAKYADAAIIIWDGKSKGSEHMIELMAKIKKPYYVYLI